MVVFVLIFSKIAKLPSGGLPYPVMVFAGMLPWQLFSTSLSEGSNSLITNANLISKVYFPRLIVPTSAVVVSFADFVISAVLLGLLMIYYGVWPSIYLLVLPLFTLLAVGASMGAGLWLRQRSTSSIAISDTWCRFSFSLVFTFRRSGSPARLSRKTGACSIHSIRWLVSSMVSAGRSTAAVPTFLFPAWQLAVWSCSFCSLAVSGISAVWNARSRM